ncbi:antibiotic biosynthesis monooxygenase family protein [Granulicoccus phenolivorans]|uniref:antibiotic biosynthesis monooxygenase family protein n=1 Tax=Granulicoccus phenolivorans TaxID=266854 RepID=UPI00047A909F|nr:antibiotic biosynthesis monooxygenase [Granulicoccus phenolivorans]
MTIIKINAITVPADSGDELARRFAKRAGAVDGQEGFEGFELLRPEDPERPWLVVTRWRDEESFQNWLNSQDFAKAHAGVAKSDGAAGHGTAEDRGAGQAGHGAGQAGHGHGAGPVGVSAELWNYQVADLS